MFRRPGNVEPMLLHRIDDLDAGYVDKGPKFAGYLYRGSASPLSSP